MTEVMIGILIGLLIVVIIAKTIDKILPSPKNVELDFQKAHRSFWIQVCESLREGGYTEREIEKFMSEHGGVYHGGDGHE